MTVVVASRSWQLGLIIIDLAPPTDCGIEGLRRQLVLIGTDRYTVFVSVQFAVIGTDEYTVCVCVQLAPNGTNKYTVLVHVEHTGWR